MHPLYFYITWPKEHNLQRDISDFCINFSDQTTNLLATKTYVKAVQYATSNESDKM